MELLGLVVLALVLAGVWIYNLLVKRRNQVSEAWAGIDVQLQRRHELVPNLVASVKGYMRHEAEVLENITMARGSHQGPEPGQAEQESSLSRSLGRLFALAEDYPELKASANFRQLHETLVEIEDHLQYARRYYNGAVRNHNNLVQSFPSNLIAGVFGFRVAEFFEIELASQRLSPNVEL